MRAASPVTRAASARRRIYWRRDLAWRRSWRRAAGRRNGCRRAIPKTKRRRAAGWHSFAGGTGGRGAAPRAAVSDPAELPVADQSVSGGNGLTTCHSRSTTTTDERPARVIPQARAAGARRERTRSLQGRAAAIAKINQRVKHLLDQVGTRPSTKTKKIPTKKRKKTFIKSSSGISVHPRAGCSRSCCY